MDEAAFDELFAANRPRVFSYLRARGVSPLDAEDLTARTFLNAWQGSYRVQPGIEPVRWLYRIAHNLLIDFYRQHHEVDSLEGLRTEPSHSQGSRIEAQDALEQAIAQLTLAQRRVIKLRYVDDLPTAQIAAALDIRPGSVRALEFRALAELRRHAW